MISGPHCRCYSSNSTTWSPSAGPSSKSTAGSSIVANVALQLGHTLYLYVHRGLANISLVSRTLVGLWLHSLHRMELRPVSQPKLHFFGQRMGILQSLGRLLVGYTHARLRITND
jgi:hypothetical protein